MKTKILLYTFIACMSLGLTSCFDAFDDLNPNAVSFDDVAWTTLEDSEAGVTALYNSLYDDYLLSIEEMSLCSDMGYPGYGRSGSPTNSSLYMYYYHTYSNSASSVSAKWAALYTGIFRANQLIESLEAMAENGVSTENEDWIEQMATARFFRGLYHFYLHSTFNHGEVIIFDFVPDNDSYYQSVSSYEKVLSFFREDLQYAYENLGENESPKDGHVTKYAAAANLGMSYLYEAQYEEAKPYLEDIITNGGYKLVTDMDLLYTTAGELNDESIFEICYTLGLTTDLSAYDSNAATNKLGYTGTTNSFTLPCWITDLYQNEVMNTYDERNISSIDEDTGEITYRSMPLRGSAMIATVQDDETSWYLETPTSNVVSVGVDSAIGYYRKYSNWDIIDNEKNLPDGARKSGKSITINRLADVYLMYAECLIETGLTTDALYYMNLIRDRWALRLLGRSSDNPLFSADDHIFDGKSYDQETLRTQLREVDRPLEMSVEGHATRFIDLRRWGADYAKERYQKLSEEVYYMIQRYIAAGDRTRWSVWLKNAEYVESASGISYTEMSIDYDLAAQNYNADLHSYWPIPLVEEQNNPSLYNKVE
ncbi:MAG: RagB/SusD family nutrient uptake outer membrane protein [Rikenellaceae bacterium]